MADIYNFNAQYSPLKIITSSEMMLTVEGGVAGGNVEYLIQGVNIQFQQPVAALGELGSGNRYWTASAPIGQMSVDRIIGEKSITAVFGKTGQGIWTAGEAKTCKLSPVGTAKGPTYTIKGAIITSFGLMVSTQQGYCRENVSIQFGSLEEKGL